MQTVLLSAKLLHHILVGLSYGPQSLGIYLGQYDQKPHRMYIPDRKFLSFLIFPVVILIDMVYNVLVGYICFSQLNYTTKKTASISFSDFLQSIFY